MYAIEVAPLMTLGSRRAGLWLALAMTATANLAFAHGGVPALAVLNEPVGVGNVVNETFEFTWVDADISIPTGTATVDFFYTANRPITFAAGVIPDDLEGEPIVTGLLEKDPDNRFVWDVSNVPSGSYHLWSRVNEPPEEEMSIQIIYFAPGVLTVAHPGDPVYPALLATSPRSSFDIADTSFEVTYNAFDPDGTGRVRIETAAVQQDGSPGEFMTLAEGLPADSEGSWTWNTESVPEGDWLLRMTIEDDRGLSFTTYGRFFLLITHPADRRDAGVTTGRDAGSMDAFIVPPPPPDPSGNDGCRCMAADRAPMTTGWWLWGALLLMGHRRRRRRA